MTETFDAIVVGSHLRYDGVWQRPQHVASRLAERAAVLFVEEEFAADRDENEWIARGALTVLRPLRRAADYTRVDAATIAAARTWLAGRRCAAWLYTPMMAPLAGALDASPLVYDCMDELANFRFAPAGIAEREADLAARADVVFAGGLSLYESRRALGPKVKLAPSGVDFERFATAQQGAPHPLLAELGAPRFGYFGVVDERIDFEIVARLAEDGGNVVLLGPLAKIDPAILPYGARLHYTGQVPYDELPRYLAGFDVAIMPFARNEATRYISPTKTPEYLAGGKPVVSTSIADVVSTFGDAVAFADDPESFARACRAALAPDARRRARGIELAREMSWDSLVARMWSAVSRP